MIVAAHRSEAVSITVRCPQFGGISQVRLSHDQVAALTGVALEHGTWRLAGDS